MDPIEQLNQYLALLQIRRKYGKRDLILFSVLFFGVLLVWMLISLTKVSSQPPSPQTLDIILMTGFLLLIVRSIVNFEVIRGSIEIVENLKRALEAGRQ